MKIRSRTAPILVLVGAAIPLLGIGNVNYNTGQLSLSTMLTNARGYQLNLPVNLNYDSRITKLDRSTWTGIGFELDVPYIERTIVGGPDDRTGHSLNYSALPASKLDSIKILYSYNEDTIRNPHFDFLNYLPLVFKTRKPDGTVVFGNGLNISESLFPCYGVDDSGRVVNLDVNCAHYRNQSQQDRYHVRNFPKGDRRIFFTEWYPGLGKTVAPWAQRVADSLVVACEPFAPWKIDYRIDDPAQVGARNGEIEAWTITDEDGVIYRFDRKVRMAPTRDFDVARIVSGKITKLDSAAYGVWRELLTSLEKHSDTTCVRWYLSYMRHPSGDTLRIEYDHAASRTIKEDPYYSDIEKFDVFAPESGKSADTLMRLTDSVVLAGDTSMHLPPRDWPEMPKAKFHLTVQLQDFVVGRKLDRAMFYTYAPDSVEGSTFRRSDIWRFHDDPAFSTMARSWFYEIKESGDEVFDSSIIHEIDVRHDDSSTHVFAQVVINFRDPQLGPMPPLVFRTSFNPSNYNNEASENYGGSNFHWLWTPERGDASDTMPHPGRNFYTFDSLVRSPAWSTLTFDKTIEFRNSVFIQSIELSFQGVNHDWEWISYSDAPWIEGASGEIRIDPGETCWITSEPNRISWNTRLMGLRYAPSSGWDISGFPLDYEEKLLYNGKSVHSPWSDSSWAPRPVPFTDTVFVDYERHDEGRSIQDSTGRIDDYYCLWTVNRNPLSRRNYQFRQLVLRDESRTILDCAWPRQIITSQQEVEFTTVGGSGPGSDVWGRPRLASISTRNRNTGEQMGKVLFSYGPSCIPGNFQLDEIWEQRGPKGPARRLYDFDYHTSNSLGTDPKFHNWHKGMINAITDVNGGRVEYTYEPGYFSFLSDGSSHVTSPQRNGFRINRIVQTGENVARPITTTVSYDSGEIAYGSGLTKASYEAHPTFLDYPFVLNLAGYRVQYGKVTERTLGKSGRTEYRYLIGANTPELRDNRDEYRIRDGYRYRLLSTTMFRNDTTSLPMAYTLNKHSLKSPGQHTEIGDAGDGLFINSERFRYHKPATQMATFQLKRKTTGSYELREKESIYYQLLQSGSPSANLASSQILSLGQTHTKRDGVVRKTFYAVNSKGLDSLVIEFQDTTGSAEGILTKKTYAYQMDRDSAGFWAKSNILSPILAFNVERRKGPSSTMLSRDVTFWSTTRVKPERSYTWREMMNDSGVPGYPWTYRTFDYVTMKPRAGNERFWLYNQEVVKYTNHGSPWWVCLPRNNNPEPYGNPTTVNVFRGDNELQIGTILHKDVSKASYREGSVFTCDYHMNNDARYWDKLNCWERGSSNPPTLSNTAHFGRKSIYVVNDTAATRNCLIFPGKSYTFSAWVRVDSGKIFMGSEFRYAKTGLEHTWPIDSLIQSSHGVDSISVTAAQCAGEWKLMKLTIPATRTALLAANKTWFARVWIGKGEFTSSTSVKAYIDDIRFYPSDAVVSTTYYDSRNRVVSVVDANDKARFIEYDEWDRPAAERNNKKTTLRRSAYNVQGEKILNAGTPFRVVSLNGGEEVAVGDTCRIQWLTDGKIQSAGVSLSTNHGQTWQNLSGWLNPNSPYWGDYPWVPQSGQTGDSCLIRIDDVTNVVSDQSDGAFKVY